MAPKIAKARKASEAHLEDLRQHELWPEALANPDVDGWPRFHAPGRAPFSSPGALCADLSKYTIGAWVS